MRIIMFVQRVVLWITVLLLLILPLLLAFTTVPGAVQGHLYSASLFAVTAVMAIRPLANLLPRLRWLAQLVILRKSVGAFSAAIIVSFMLSKFIIGGVAYLASFVDPASWSLVNYGLLARLADITAVILLITSNDYSKRLLGRNWKRIQRLAYVYFYSGALYEWLFLGIGYAGVLAAVVTVLVLAAFVYNRLK